MKQLNIKIRIMKELAELNSLSKYLLLEYGILCKVTMNNNCTKLELHCLENDLEFTKKLMIKELKKRLPGFKLAIEWTITEDHSGNWEDSNLLANINKELNTAPLDIKEYNPESNLKTLAEQFTNLDKPSPIQPSNTNCNSKNIDQVGGKMENLDLSKTGHCKDDAYDTIGRNDLTLLDEVNSQSENYKVIFVSYAGRGITFEISKFYTLKKLYLAIQREFPITMNINSLFCLNGNEKFYVTGINALKQDEIYYAETNENMHFDTLEGFYNRLYKYLTKEEVARILQSFELESIHYETLKMLDAQKLSDMGINQIGLQDMILYVIKYN
ncbi:hypothetical protein HDV06_004849 [Boothiomyces sp. JEL0866]|nr:hypothetical protein HDV06_004849 [Boothiomyces sp. JEL0866]